MTFWQFDAPEPGQSYDYPALGFTAIDGAILDGDATTPKITKAPGPEWSVVASGPESGITRQAEPSYDPDYVEPSDGSLLVYSDQANSHVNMSPADFIQGPAAGVLNTAFVNHGTTDPGPSLPPGTEYVWFQTDGSGKTLDILSGLA